MQNIFKLDMMYIGLPKYSHGMGGAMGGNIPPNSSKKTETVSYRIRADLKSALEEEASKLGINASALVSQIFNRHISWGRYVGQLKCIPVSKEFLRLMFESMPRTEIEKVGRLLGES